MSKNLIGLLPEEESSTTPFFWRNVTEADVKQAITGSFLETICTAFAKNYNPVPLPLVCMQGITLMSCALTHRQENEPVQSDLFATGASLVDDEFPASKSRLFINTLQGNVPNAYVLIVAPSGTGKGLGNFQLLRTLGYREPFRIRTIIQPFPIRYAPSLSHACTRSFSVMRMNICRALH